MINKIEERQFEMATAKGMVVVMLAFEEKCKSCEDMKPIFEKFSVDNPHIKCYQIDYKFTLPAKPEGELIAKFDILSFPTFLTYENGVLTTKMKGPVNAETLSMPFLSLAELKGKAYDCIKHIEGVDILKQDLQAINAMIELKSATPAEVKKKPNIVLPGDPAEENAFDCCQ